MKVITIILSKSICDETSKTRSYMSIKISCIGISHSKSISELTSKTRLYIFSAQAERQKGKKMFVGGLTFHEFERKKESKNEKRLD